MIEPEVITRMNYPYNEANGRNDGGFGSAFDGANTQTNDISLFNKTIAYLNDGGRVVLGKSQ